MIAVMVPSRGRPESIRRLQQAWRETTTGVAQLFVYVDDDDEKLNEYLVIDGVSVEVVPRKRLGPTMNDAAPDLAKTFSAVGFMGDDHLPRTVGWDRIIMNEIEATPLSVVYGNDVIRGEGLASAAFMDSEIVRRIGYFVPPGAIHLYLDDFWMLLGRSLGTLKYLDNVIIEHLHPISGKVEWDESYAESNSQRVYSADEATFLNYKETILEDDLRKLRG